MTHFDPSRFGVSTNLLGNPEDVSGAVSQLGRDFPVVELEMEDGARSLFDADAIAYDLTIQALDRIRQSRGLAFSVHAPYVGQDCDLSADESDMRQRSVRLVKEAIRLTADVGAARLTYHPGHLGKTPKRRLMEHLMHSLEELVPWGSDRGVLLSIENMGADRPNYIVFSPAEHLELCRQTGTQLTFDCVHHASLVSAASQFFHDLELLLPHIGNIHLADAIPPTHVHLPIGKGTMPLADILVFLTERGYRGNVIVEEMGGKFSSEAFLDQARGFRETFTPVAA